MNQDEPMPDPTPEEIRAATKKEGSIIILRVPHGVKGRAVRASRKKGGKLTPWIIEAITEKSDRELGPEK